MVWDQNSWLQRAILLLIFLFPILVATVRNGASTIFVLLVLLSLFCPKKRWGELSDRERHFLIGLVLFFLMSSLSLVLTEDLRSGLQRLMRYGRLIVFIPVYLMFRQQGLETGEVFFAGASVALLVMSGQAFYQVEILNRPFAHGAYHKIIMGNMAVFFSALVFVGALLSDNGGKLYVFAGLSILAGLYTGLLSGTRTAWLFVPLIVSCLLWMYRKRLSNRSWKVIVCCIIVSIFFVSYLRPQKLTQGFKEVWSDLERFQQEEDTNTSLGARLVMWRNSLLIFKDSPLFGTGIGDFKNDSLVLLKKGLSYKNDFAVNQKNAHNLYFQLLAEGGLIGLLILVVVLFLLPFVLLYNLWQNASDPYLHYYSLSGLIGIFAFAWFGVSSSWVNRSPVITTYCLTMLVFITSSVNKTKLT